MRPFDPRLVRVSPAVPRIAAVQVALGAVTTAAILVQATALAAVISGVFREGWDAAAATPWLAAIAVAGVVRGGARWASTVAGRRGAASVVSGLRERLLRRLVELGPARLGGERSGELASLVRRLDGLEAYFSRYLPQLVLAALVPLALLLYVARTDLGAALVLVATLPLVPLFMVLIGLGTEHVTRRRYRSLALLSGHFLDVLQGLPTLRAFGRGRAQLDRLRETGERYRRATMATLRVAFLSAFVLELLATMGTALVAVTVGLRLIDGGIDLRTALTVLIITPEVYIPLRQVGAEFHAGADGAAAADRAFELLSLPEAPAGGGSAVPALDAATIGLRGVVHRYPGRDLAALDGLTLELRPGETVALTGVSGAGKSTVLALLLGLLEPDAGQITVAGTDLRDLDVEAWRRALTWVPQRPHLLAGSVADNIRLSEPGATDADVVRAARAAGADGFIRRLPRGYATEVGEGGSRLSGGQRQRIALARALLRRDARLILLDEPDAGLDAATAEELRATLREACTGRTALVVVHDGSFVDWADRVVTLAGGRLVEQTAMAATA